MRFPPADRVEYSKTSLVEVIFQLKFPPILKIETEPVSELQEHLRTALPGYDRREIGQVGAPVIIANGQPLPLPQFSDRRVEHAFLSRGGETKVTLGRDFVACATQVYTRWDDFKSTLQLATAATHEIYAPAPGTRLGLRYQNVIRRSALGLTDRPWGDLLRPALIGLLADEAMVLDHALREEGFELDISGLQGRGRVFHGLVQQNDEQCYLLDTDFFVEQEMDWRNIHAVADELHRQSWDCFRYFVGSRLHKSMEPRGQR